MFRSIRRFILRLRIRFVECRQQRALYRHRVLQLKLRYLQDKYTLLGVAILTEEDQ
jgi:hypothetical protein